MICAVCWEPLEYDGPLGYVHHDGRQIGNDGHTAVPIQPQPVGGGYGRE